VAAAHEPDPVVAAAPPTGDRICGHLSLLSVYRDIS
jgi:hypothetical protein